MFQPVMTRTERRVEKKNTVFLLVLILAVALVSFALGVMIGRGNSRHDLARQDQASEAPRIPVAKEISKESPSPQPPVSAEPANPVPAAPTAAVATAPQANPGEAPLKAVAQPPAAAKLSFYESLPKGEKAPLGSGINLPPESTPKPLASSVPSKPKAALETSPVSAKAPTVPSEVPVATKGGAYILQVASFASVDDAGVLQSRLEKKGHVAFVQQADLGAKGVWYRVCAGPYKNSDDASAAAQQLKKTDGLTAIVRKR